MNNFFGKETEIVRNFDNIFGKQIKRCCTHEKPGQIACLNKDSNQRNTVCVSLLKPSLIVIIQTNQFHPYL